MHENLKRGRVELSDPPPTQTRLCKIVSFFQSSAEYINSIFFFNEVLIFIVFIVT